ncbi:MAG: accessory gene regulator B family protein [Desulfitobacterium sp.]|nr:accessory gene regulator B family protein [Desulfitobacterium sp.]
MNSLEKMSLKLTYSLTKDLDYDEEKREIITYAIETILLTILGSSLLLLFAFLLNVLKPAIIAGVSGMFLRRVSGGFHFNTPFKCLFFGATVYTLLGLASQKIVELSSFGAPILWIVLGIAFILISILAPVDSPSKPIHSNVLKRNLKIASMGLILLAFLIIILSPDQLLNVSMCLGVLYQSLTLLPVFNQWGGE